MTSHCTCCLGEQVDSEQEQVAYSGIGFGVISKHYQTHYQNRFPKKSW